MESGYPKWKYHKSHAPKIVHSSKEEMALGDGWAESPAALDEVKKPASKPADKPVKPKADKDATKEKKAE